MFSVIFCYLFRVSSQTEVKKNLDSEENRTPDPSTEDFISIHYSTGGCLADYYF